MTLECREETPHDIEDIDCLNREVFETDAEARLKEMGYDATFVLGHKEYYPKFGYKPSHSHFGITSNFEVDDEFFMVKPLSEKGVSGLSGTVFYEPEFDSV